LTPCKWEEVFTENVFYTGEKRLKVWSVIDKAAMKLSLARGIGPIATQVAISSRDFISARRPRDQTRMWLCSDNVPNRRGLFPGGGDAAKTMNRTQRRSFND
jgi:hypothetical protein